MVSAILGKKPKADPEVERLQKERAQAAEAERLSLAKQDSDSRRAALAGSKGRRSLFSGSESGLRKTLG